MKTVPYVPLSHPFAERLIGTVRRDYLDQIPFWGALDLERKLLLFKEYYNKDRVHRGLNGIPPTKKAVSLAVRSLVWTNIVGKSTAEVCISCQQRLEF